MSHDDHDTKGKEPFDFDRYSVEAGEAFDAEKAKLDQRLKGERVIISLVGNVNAGKSKTVNAITGRPYADVKPVAGWTKRVALYPLPGFPAVCIADTPGLEDVNEEVSARTDEFVEKDADVVLFFVQATVGVTRLEREAFLRLRAMKRPVLAIVNKVDLPDAVDLPVILADCREKLGLVGPDDVLYAVSAKTGDGIPELTTAIAQLLARSGKDIIFARVARHKDRVVQEWVAVSSAAAFVLGVVPIPGSDTVPLTALQVALMVRIAYAYEVEVTRKDVLPLITNVAAGTVGKAIFRTALKALGWLGGPVGAFMTSTVAGVIAGSMTYGLGKAAQAYYRTGMSKSFEELHHVFVEGAEEYRRFKSLPVAGSRS